jgi:antitoxin component YwqK of YwqJK toxin-antitoxin module
MIIKKFSGTAFVFCEIWSFENTRHQFNNWMKTTNNYYRNNQKKGHLRNQVIITFDYILIIE